VTQPGMARIILPHHANADADAIADADAG